MLGGCAGGKRGGDGLGFMEDWGWRGLNGRVGSQREGGRSFGNLFDGLVDQELDSIAFASATSRILCVFSSDYRGNFVKLNPLSPITPLPSPLS